MTWNLHFSVHNKASVASLPRPLVHLHSKQQQRNCPQRPSGSAWPCLGGAASLAGGVAILGRGTAVLRPARTLPLGWAHCGSSALQPLDT